MYRLAVDPPARLVLETYRLRSRCVSSRLSSRRTAELSRIGSRRRLAAPLARRQRPGSALEGPPGRTPGHTVRAASSAQLIRHADRCCPLPSTTALQPAPAAAFRPPYGLAMQSAAPSPGRRWRLSSLREPVLSRARSLAGRRPGPVGARRTSQVGGAFQE